jgi:hypothetical protein
MNKFNHNLNKIFKMKKVIVIFLHIINQYGFAQNKSCYSFDSLPNVISSHVTKNYSNFTFKAFIMVLEKGVVTQYKVEMEKPRKGLDLVYDTKGTLLEKTKYKILTFDGTEKIKTPPTNTGGDGHTGHSH